jgi:hypothetical protein
LTRSCPRQQRRVLELAMSETVDEMPQPVYEPQDTPRQAMYDQT